MEKRLNAPDIKVILAFAAVYIIWGTTYLAIKIGLKDMPPFLMAAFRFLIAGVVLLLICLAKKTYSVRNTIWKNILLGAFMLTLGQGILFWAELHLSSGLTAVLVSTLPISYIIADRQNWKAYFHSKLTIFSIVLGLAGILMLFKDQLSGGSDDSSMQLIASAVVLISCLCWATGSIYYKHHSKPENLFPDVSWQLLGGAAACFIVSFFADNLQSFHIADVSAKSWGAVTYLAIAGSIMAFTSSYYLLSVRPAAVVGTYAYVNPIIAVILGILIADESISTSQIIGIVIILTAAYLSNQVKLKTK